MNKMAYQANSFSMPRVMIERMEEFASHPHAFLLLTYLLYHTWRERFADKWHRYYTLELGVALGLDMGAQIDRALLVRELCWLEDGGYIERVTDKAGGLTWQIRINTNDLDSDLEVTAYHQGYADELTTAEAQGVKESPLRPGYVYLLEGGGYYKIGLSNNPARRFGQISPRLPFEATLVCIVATGDMHALEAELHERFADKRANGEWFELDEEDVVYIQGLANE